jgi:hypothetical protein
MSEIKYHFFRKQIVILRAFQSQASKQNTFLESLIKNLKSDIFKNVRNRNFFQNGINIFLFLIFNFLFLIFNFYFYFIFLFL